MEKNRKYRIIIEGELVTNMTAEEIKKNAYAGVYGWTLDKQRVTVKPIISKKRKETTKQ